MRSRWTLGDENHGQAWWIPLVVAVLAAATWGLLGLVEGGCEAGPRGGCVAADGYKANGWVFFLAAMPTYFVVGTGLTSRHWPPAVGVAVGGAVCAVYVLTQGRTPAHLITASVLLVLAVLAPVSVGRRRRRPGRCCRSS
ncbi:hypothetical protein ABZ318_16075 [Streptomyces sp. NPDC006197]|uniref:hypothetical protein n=1 Tax=Streptomyces sp. NPDC006197 TaxID=3156685 RepID=UPI0033A811A5